MPKKPDPIDALVKSAAFGQAVLALVREHGLLRRKRRRATAKRTRKPKSAAPKPAPKPGKKAASRALAQAPEAATA